MKKVSVGFARRFALTQVLVAQKRATLYDSQYGNLPPTKQSALIWIQKLGATLAQAQIEDEKKDPSLEDRRWQLAEAVIEVEMSKKMGRVAEVHGISYDEARDAFMDGWEIITTL